MWFVCDSDSNTRIEDSGFSKAFFIALNALSLEVDYFNLVFKVFGNHFIVKDCNLLKYQFNTQFTQQRKQDEKEIGFNKEFQ